MPKKTGRFFSFGCSFTRYHWPTWADILGREFDSHENWGKLGAGNNYIANSVVECCLTRNISANDTVIVKWSAPMREDRYVNGRWVVSGNIFSKFQKIYDGNFVKNLVDTRGCYVRDLTLMLLTKKLLDSTGCRYVFTSMSDFDTITADNVEPQVDEVSDLLDIYQEVLGVIRPSVYRLLFNNDWNSRPWIYQQGRDFLNLQARYDQCSGVDWPSLMELMTSDLSKIPKNIHDEIFNTKRWNWADEISKIKRHDGHPTPNEYLEYIDAVLDEFPLSQDTRDLVNEIDKKVRAFEPLPNWESQFNVTYPARW